MPAKESFDIDGLMVFRSDLTAVDQDGNIVAGVITPDRYFPSDREPLSGSQTGRYTNTTAYWESHSSIVPSKGDVYIYSDGGSIEQGGVTVYVPKIKVGDGVTTVGNLPFTDSDNQGGGTEEVFVCTFTGTNTISCNRTFSQIYEAWQNKKEVIGVYSAAYYRACYLSETLAIFYNINSPRSNEPKIYSIYTSNSGASWGMTEFVMQEKLVSGTNIKTVNGNTLLGRGNLTTCPAKYVISESNATGNTITPGTSQSSSRGYLNTISIHHITGSQQTITARCSIADNGMTVRMIIDNLSNSNNLTINLSVYLGDSYIQNQLLSPSLQTTSGWEIQAGGMAEFEITANSSIAVIKRNF